MIVNGQPGNATTFNNGFMSRTVDTDTAGKLTVNNTQPESGAPFDVQQYVNEIADADGTVGMNDSTRKNYTSTNKVSNGMTRKAAIAALDGAFSTSTGHDHDGTDSKQISAVNLLNINKFTAVFQETIFDSAGGTSDDVSSAFIGKTSGGATAAAGVVTSAPDNRCEIRSKLSGEQIEDAGGQKVYGRITEAASVWTLTYYTNEGGVETAHNLSTQDIKIYFKEVFNLENRPTFAPDVGVIGSLDYTADVVDATQTQRGAVSLSDQTFAGLKTFFSGLITNLFRTPKQDIASAATITALSSAKPYIKITGATATELQGIADGADGKHLYLYNDATASLTVKNENAGASAANRIITQNAADLRVPEKTGVHFIYDSTQSRWVVLSTVGSGGGGGGAGGLQWTLESYDSGPAATPRVEFGGGSGSFFPVADFAAGMSQFIDCGFQVPASYVPGNQINIKLNIYSAATANTGHLIATSFLVRNGTDSILSTTNSHASTNTAITFSGVAYRCRQIVVDLTDGSGLINGVAVSPGDLILFYVERTTDTATEDVSLSYTQSEVTFA